MGKLRGKAAMGAGKLVTQCLVGSMLVAGILVLTSQAAAAAAQTSSGSVTCSLSGVVRFSPPLSRSGGGTHASRVTASLSYCTSNSGIVESLSSGRLRGVFASSPFSCSSSSQTGAALSGVVRWQGTAWPHGGIGRTTVEDGGAVGSFPGGAVVSLQVPAALSGCAGGKVRSAIVSGTISIGQECAGVDGPITVYPMVPPICGAQNYMPTSITTGPDGALWYTTNRNNLIGRTTTAGVTTLYPLPYLWDGEWGNGGITAGSDGALWFIANSGLAIGRITTSGSVSTFPLPSGVGLASAVTSGPDGAMWFTTNNNAGPNAIGQLTTSGQMTMFTDPSLGTANWNSDDHRYLWDITSGPDGALWFSMEYASNEGQDWIGTISTSGAVTTYLLPFAAAPTALTAGPDGAIWFGTDAYGVIGRVTTSGVFSEFSDPSQIGQVLGMTAGPDGALWFTNYSVPGDTGFVPYPPIGRIATDGTITTYGNPYVEEGAMGITAGPDGAMWFSDHINDSIGRVSVP